MGQLVAEWIVDGRAGLRRVAHGLPAVRAGHYQSRAYTLARTVEVYATYYDIRFPGQERLAGRPLRVSPTYARLESLGACFGEKSGWERANWFESNAGDGDEGAAPARVGGRGVVAGHRRRASRVPGTGRAVRRDLVRQDRGVGPGGRGVPPAPVRQRRGPPAGGDRVHLDAGRGGRHPVRPHRDAPGRGPVPADHRHGVRRSTTWPGSGRTPPTTARSGWRTSRRRTRASGLWGPAARDVLQPIAADPLDFPYLQARPVAVGPVPCLAARVTYVGELGWELYCPMEFGLALWDAIWTAGRPLGLVAGGYRAIDALRLEKGYRVWAVRHHAGRHARPGRYRLRGQARQGRGLRGPGGAGGGPGTAAGHHAVLPGPRRPAVRGTRGGAGPGRRPRGGPGDQRRVRLHVARSIAYAYLPAEASGVGQRVEVDLFGAWVGAEVAAEPLFDPKGARIRA